MIGLCDDRVAGRDQPGNKRRTDAAKPEYQRQDDCGLGYTVTHGHPRVRAGGYQRVLRRQPAVIRLSSCAGDASGDDPELPEEHVHLTPDLRVWPPGPGGQIRNEHAWIQFHSRTVVQQAHRTVRICASSARPSNSVPLGSATQPPAQTSSAIQATLPVR